MRQNFNIKEINDPVLWLKYQKQGFFDIYNIYHDDDKSPFTEGIDNIVHRMENPNITHYLIWCENDIIGGFRIKKLTNTEYRLGILFILPEYQNKGYGSKIMKDIEKIAKTKGAKTFELDTIFEESRNIHFYEKLGYVLVNDEKQTIHDKMHIVAYKKHI